LEKQKEGRLSEFQILRSSDPQILKSKKAAPSLGRTSAAIIGQALLSPGILLRDWIGGNISLSGTL
jgi:hypothetical protein